ncbi:hypothetical protein AAMO2058_000436100 [Amorphochlora amoebiformis]
MDPAPTSDASDLKKQNGEGSVTPILPADARNAPECKSFIRRTVYERPNEILKLQGKKMFRPVQKPSHSILRVKSTGTSGVTVSGTNPILTDSKSSISSVDRTNMTVTFDTGTQNMPLRQGSVAGGSTLARRTSISTASSRSSIAGRLKKNSVLDTMEVPEKNFDRLEDRKISSNNKDKNKASGTASVYGGEDHSIAAGRHDLNVRRELYWNKVADDIYPRGISILDAETIANKKSFQHGNAWRKILGCCIPIGNFFLGLILPVLALLKILFRPIIPWCRKNSRDQLGMVGWTVLWMTILATGFYGLDFVLKNVCNFHTSCITFESGTGWLLIARSTGRGITVCFTIGMLFVIKPVVEFIESLPYNKRANLSWRRNHAWLMWGAIILSAIHTWAHVERRAVMSSNEGFENYKLWTGVVLFMLFGIMGAPKFLKPLNSMGVFGFLELSTMCCPFARRKSKNEEAKSPEAKNSKNFDIIPKSPVGKRSFSMVNVTFQNELIQGVKLFHNRPYEMLFEEINRFLPAGTPSLKMDNCRVSILVGDEEVGTKEIRVRSNQQFRCELKHYKGKEVEPLPILTYELFPPCLNLTRRKRSVGGSVFNFTAVESHAGALTAKEGGIQVQKKYRDFKDYFLRMLMRCTYEWSYQRRRLRPVKILYNFTQGSHKQSRFINRKERYILNLKLKMGKPVVPDRYGYYVVLQRGVSLCSYTMIPHSEGREIELNIRHCTFIDRFLDEIAALNPELDESEQAKTGETWYDLGNDFFNVYGPFASSDYTVANAKSVAVLVQVLVFAVGSDLMDYHPEIGINYCNDLKAKAQIVRRDNNKGTYLSRKTSTRRSPQRRMKTSNETAGLTLTERRKLLRTHPIWPNSVELRQNTETGLPEEPMRNESDIVVIGLQRVGEKLAEHVLKKLQLSGFDVIVCSGAWASHINRILERDQYSTGL